MNDVTSQIMRTCRSCGCTDERACPDGCWWVEDDLCSTCQASNEKLQSQRFPDGYELKETYEMTCIGCGSEYGMRPGMAMIFGLNSGHGTCPQCKAFLHLCIDTDADRCVSQKWDDYLRSQGIEPAPSAGSEAAK